MPKTAAGSLCLCILRWLIDQSNGAYTIRDQQALYFLTFTVVGWVDVFTRPAYKDSIIESLRYCQEKKGLELFAYCLMTTHLHLIARAAKGQELAGIVRDFKKFTAYRLFKEITETQRESWRAWLKWLLSQEGERNSNNVNFPLWQQHSHGVELRTVERMRQRPEYTHQSSVRAGICYQAEDYVYSSASFYAGLPVSLLF